MSRSNSKKSGRDFIARTWERIFNLSSPSAPTSLAPNSPASLGTGSTSTAIAAWVGLDIALQCFHKSAALFPPLQSAISTLISCLEAVDESRKRQRDYEELAAELKMLCESLSKHLQESRSARMSEFIERTALSIHEQVRLIDDKQTRGTARRLVEAQHDADVLLRCYRRIEALFRQLQVDANLSTLSVAEAQLVETRLASLLPAKLATYNSSLSTEIYRRTCTENTRTAVLSKLNDWTCDPSAPNVFWMNGMAGTGKTTIACTLADMLKKRKQLAASFFCTRTTAECRDVSRIVPTIAYQLARYLPSFQSVLCRVLGNDPDISSQTISTQFERLLKEPLLEVGGAIPAGLVVVIDALDECVASKGIELVLDMLFRYVPGLPLKFFVSSRPEPSIRNKIQNQFERVRSVYVLHDIEHSLVQADIELYLQEELRFMSASQVRQLAELSGNLFIYAATAVRYIRTGETAGDLGERLETMLSVNSMSNQKHAEIDELYTTILLEALDNKALEKGEKERMRVVLWTAVCAREPVSTETLAALAGIRDPGKAFTALQPLRSVLYVSETGNVVSTLHASFADFLFTPNRSTKFFCDEGKHSQLITRWCFESMKQQLRFNICGLESSYIPDEKATDLRERVDRAVSPTLAYVCRYWGDHLRQAAASDELCALLNDFLSNRLLFWMEVMNLKQWMGIGVRVILVAKLWLMAICGPLDLVKICEDARNFVAGFAANPVSQCTPHLYISALPFCDRSSSVFRDYWKRTLGLIKLKGTAIQRRNTTMLASWGVQSEVNSVAFSLDGTQLAFGCEDGSITVKDVHDGTIIGAPFKGHTNSVNSVAFSPDGTRIASGSSDHTIRLWSVQAGALISGPLEGHTDWVRSVAFSPDGTCLTSGSDDCTIRIWNVQDGAPIGTPFSGHADRVWSVAFSPNGTLIISGSSDLTIRIWDVRDGTPIGVPLEGHTGSVKSVAFSPDGIHIVSGSADHTIRVWNVRLWSLVGAAFEGHTDEVTSVSFSPDGTRIVSGSNDHTICLWNMKECSLVRAPFEGHTSSVTSVVFSLDGTRILSGSYDQSICIWNVQDCRLIGAPSKDHARTATLGAPSPDGTRAVSDSQGCTIRGRNVHDSSPLTDRFDGHTGRVLSVAFSPDGARIVSGSEDCTIRIWDVKDGTLVGVPFEGHNDRILSVAFSPDGTRIVSGSDDCTILVWDVQDGTLIGAPFEGHTLAVWSVAFSPDGARIVSGSEDCTIRIWDVKDGTLIGAPFEGHTESVTSVAFSPDGTRVLSGSNDCTICIWDVQNGTPLGAQLKGHNYDVKSVAFSPDGTCIVSASADCTVCVWNVQDGTLLKSPFKGHTDWVRSVAFAPDSKRVISGSDDGTICVWDVQEGTLIGPPFEGHTGCVFSVAFSPDGTRVVSGSNDCTIRIWGACDGASMIDRWTIAQDGWVKGNDSQLLFWVPPDLARYLPTPHNAWVIGPEGVTYADYKDLLLGDRWHDSFLLK